MVHCSSSFIDLPEDIVYIKLASLLDVYKYTDISPLFCVMNTNYSISQIQYTHNTYTHKVALLVDSLQRPLLKILQEAYSVLLPLD